MANSIMSGSASSQYTSDKSNIYSKGFPEKTKLQQDKIDEYNQQQKQQQQQEQQKQQNLNYSGSNAFMYLFFLIFMSMWFIVTIYAIVKSFTCAAKSGSVAEKVIGILLALFLGPFYLIYLSSMDGYCKDLPIV